MLFDSLAPEFLILETFEQVGMKMRFVNASKEICVVEREKNENFSYNEYFDTTNFIALTCIL